MTMYWIRCYSIEFDDVVPNLMLNIKFDVNSSNSMILYRIRWRAYHAYNFPPRPPPAVSNSMLIHRIRWYCIEFDDVLIMRVGTTFLPVLLLLYRIRCVFQFDDVQIMRSLPATLVCSKFTCYCCNISIEWEGDGIYVFMCFFSTIFDDQFEQDRDAPSQKFSAPDEPTWWQQFIRQSLSSRQRSSRWFRRLMHLMNWWCMHQFIRRPRGS
jgi:hypothetical protein